jgi:hypothetical protein
MPGHSPGEQPATCLLQLFLVAHPTPVRQRRHRPESAGVRRAGLGRRSPPSSREDGARPSIAAAERAVDRRSRILSRTRGSLLRTRLRAAFTPSLGEAHRGCRRWRSAHPSIRPSFHTGGGAAMPAPWHEAGAPDARSRPLRTPPVRRGRIRSAGPALQTPAAGAYRVPKGRDRVIRHLPALVSLPPAMRTGRPRAGSRQLLPPIPAIRGATDQAHGGMHGSAMRLA